MSNTKPSPQENKLVEALRLKGLEVVQQFWDGHKHVDIFIPVAKLDIELDDMGHFTNPNQILSDFNREYWSDKAGYYTFHIPYIAIDSIYFDKIVSAIEQVVIRLVEKMH